MQEKPRSMENVPRKPQQYRPHDEPATLTRKSWSIVEPSLLAPGVKTQSRYRRPSALSKHPSGADSNFVNMSAAKASLQP